MAKQKQKWTTEEEHALCAGVEKHGHGKWKVILSDPEFASSLVNRSNIDLKDKWRNLGASGGMSSSREKIRTPRLEGVGIINNSIVSSPEPLSAVPLLDYDGTAESFRSSLDKRTVPEYEAMIFEALFNVDDPNGPDANKIMDFIEARYEVPQNFRRSVASKLRRLVLNGELEKVDNCYKFMNAFSGAETSQQEGVKTKNSDNQKAPEGSPPPLATENSPEDSPTPLPTGNTPEDSPPPLSTENTLEDSQTPLAIENPQEDSPTPVATETAPEGSQPPPVATENAPERPPPPVPTETLEDATLYAVYTIAVAENVEQEAAAASKKAELLRKALEESMARLMFIEELHQKWSEPR